MIKLLQFENENNENNGKKQQACHRIFCLDCSGSMSDSMSAMRKQLKNKLPTLIRDTDFISLIWFSGMHEYGTIFEHLSIKDLNDLQMVHRVIDQYVRSLGSTGFVGPIRKAKELCEKYPEQPQIFFLSDGGENCWPRDETRKAFAEMRGIPMVIVEYQYCCDRVFLKELAEIADAASVFNEDFEHYENTFCSYMSNRLSKCRTVDVHVENDLVYFDEDTFVIKSGKDGHVSIPEHISYAWEIRRVDNNEEQKEEQKEKKEVYVAMLYATQTRNHPIMMKCLSLLGDVHLTKRYSTCFSKQDYARLFETLKGCYFDPEQYAFVEGVDHSFQPVDDAFNVVEFLNLIESDKKSRFYPYHPSFKYERISKEVKEEDMTRFVPNRDLGSSFSLVFNQSRANISLGCQVYGYNESVDEQDNVTITPANAYRNYAILKDGIKNVNLLPLKLSSETYSKLVDEKCILDDVYNKNKIYDVNLTNLPVVNRKFASAAFTSTEFCEKHIQLHLAKGNAKYLKKMLEEFEEKKESSVNEKVYERKKVDPNSVRDFYCASELDVKIAKCSVIPTVNEKLIQKMNNTPEKLTLSEELLYTIHKLYISIPSEEKKEWLLNRLAQEKVIVKALTMDLEQAKMAILIGGCWFTGNVVDDKTFTLPYTYGEKTYTFEVTIEISDVKVYMD